MSELEKSSKMSALQLQVMDLQKQLADKTGGLNSGGDDAGGAGGPGKKKRRELLGGGAKRPEYVIALKLPCLD